MSRLYHSLLISMLGVQSIHLVIPLVYFSQRSLLRSHSSSLRRLRLRVKGFVQKDCAFAGHWLGEYSALASIADVLHISALVDVFSTITMQRADT